MIAIGTATTDASRVIYNNEDYSKVYVGSNLVWGNDDSNLIYYTSTDDNVVTPFATGSSVFGANMVSNTYDSTTGGCITFDGSVTKIGDNCFYECSTLETITIPNSVTLIRQSAFRRCYGLTSIVLPSSITGTLYEYAFSECTAMTSVTLSQGITAISNNCFEYCYNLQSISIPTGVTSIGAESFLVCRNLTGNLIIPSGVTYLGGYMFNSCTGLTSVTVMAPYNASMSANVFVYSSFPIYVPSSELTRYKALWSTEQDRIFAIPS